MHVVGVGLAWSLVLPRLAPARRNAVKQRWSRKLLKILNLRVEVEGELPTHSGPVVLVANHVSWLDIHVIDAVLPTRFVAKSEIRSWPIAGRLAASAGTVFIDRGRRRDTGRIANVVTDALAAGDVVGVFPEGTTSEGHSVLKFHASLLQPAVDADAPLLPVALTYHTEDGSRTEAAAYTGQMSLVQSITRVARQSQIVIRLTPLPLVAAVGRHRRDLALELHTSIAARVAASGNPETIHRVS